MIEIELIRFIAWSMIMSGIGIMIGALASNRPGKTNNSVESAFISGWLANDYRNEGSKKRTLSESMEEWKAKP